MTAVRTSRLLLFACAFSLSLAQNMYCGDKECYDVLEVEQSATMNEIKKNYRRISLKYHPDKNKEPEALKIFQQVAAAYTVLSDKTKRAAYDYYLLHPEDFAYNNAMYYRYVYAPKSDLRIVLLGFILIVSVCQYGIQYTRHQQAIDHFKKGDKIRAKAILIQQERNADKGSKKSPKSKKKTKEQERKELQDIIDELVGNLHISGGYSKPNVWNLLIVQILILPYTIFKYIKWQVVWFYRHSIKNEEYDAEEQLYLTCKALGISKDLFLSDEFADRRENYLSRRLWEAGKIEELRAEEEEEFKRKYPQKYKKALRMKKNHKTSYGCPDDDGDY